MDAFVSASVASGHKIFEAVQFIIIRKHYRGAGSNGAIVCVRFFLADLHEHPHPPTYPPTHTHTKWTSEPRRNSMRSISRTSECFWLQELRIKIDFLKLQTEAILDNVWGSFVTTHCGRQGLERRKIWYKREDKGEIIAQNRKRSWHSNEQGNQWFQVNSRKRCSRDMLGLPDYNDFILLRSRQYWLSQVKGIDMLKLLFMVETGANPSCRLIWVIKTEWVIIRRNFSLFKVDMLTLLI